MRSVYLLAVALALTVSLALGRPSASVADQKASGEHAEAAKLFGYYCTMCHGENGDGTGPAAAALDPKPRDFTDEKVMSGISEERIVKSITEGREGTAMAAWGGTLTEEQIRKLARYVRTFSNGPPE